MKPKENYLNYFKHRFSPFPLYLSDIEEIQKFADARKLKMFVSDDKYEYSNLNDLIAHQGLRIMRLNVEFRPTNSRSGLELNISPVGLVLRSVKEDKLVSLWHEAKSILERRVPKYVVIMNPWWWVWTAIISFLLTTGEDAKVISESQLNIRYGFLIFSVIMSALSFYYVRLSRGIHLKRKHEISTLWDRYGEKVILLILGSFFGVVGKIILERFNF